MDERQQVRVPILDLGCGGSDAQSLERALMATDGVLAAYVNRATETAYVDVRPGELDAWAVVRAVEKAGFRPGRPADR